MADLNLDSAEALNVTVPWGSIIDVVMDCTEDDGITPKIITGVWDTVIMARNGQPLLTLTNGAGFTISGTTITYKFGYILTRLKPDEYFWRTKKTEGGLTAPIWKGSLIVTK